MTAVRQPRARPPRRCARCKELLPLAQAIVGRVCCDGCLAKMDEETKARRERGEKPS